MRIALWIVTVLLGVMFAVLAGQFVVRSQVAWWPLLTVGLVGAAGYIFGQPRGGIFRGRRIGVGQQQPAQRGRGGFQRRDRGRDD